MKQYTADTLLVRPNPPGSDVIVSVTPEEAGWKYISFQARRLATNEAWAFNTGENELTFVDLTGRADPQELAPRGQRARLHRRSPTRMTRARAG